MSAKTKAVCAAWVTAITGFLGWLATLPPDTQTGIFSQIENVFPSGWRAQIGAVLKLVATFSTVFMAYQAAHSGPQTPPPNPPQ